MKPKGLAKTLLGTSALTAAIVVSFIAPSAHAVNAAWNTDASSGNFNTAQWSINTVPIAGGTYTVVSGDALFFGTSTTTTLNNDLVGATYNGLTFNAGASAFSIGGNSFTLNGNIANNSSNLQTINNNMTSTAARVFTGGTAGLTLGGSYTTAVAATYAGVVNIKGATTITQSGANNQGFLTIGAGTNSTVTLSDGGSLSIGGTTAGTKPNSIIANNNSTSVLNVGAVDKSTSGTLTVAAETGFVLGNNSTSANGSLNINSGTATINSGGTAGSTDIRSFVALGRDTGTGTINLNGGTLATGRNFVRDGSATADTLGAANFNFAGGTLKALANQTDWLNSSTKNTNQLALTSVTTTSANSAIDSNGFSVAVNNNISGTGGFNITSTTPGGTVTFGGTNTYTGATVINSGTLALSSTGSISNTSGVSLGTNGTFDVSAKAGGYTVNNLSGSGTVTGSLSVSSQLAIGNSPGTVNFSGDLTLAPGSTYLYELTGGANTADLGDVGGTLTLTGSILDLVQLGTYTDGDKFTLFAYDGALTGTFNGLADDTTFTDAGGEWRINYNDTTAGLNGGTSLSNTYVTITAVPEPAAALLGGLGMLGLLRRRRVA